MSKYYSTAKLSQNISETPEGFLICENVCIARAGDMMYADSEVDLDSKDGKTVITRTIEDITAPEVMASFEGKPVTLNHPMSGDFVTPDTWKLYSVGVVQNVRPGAGENSDKLMADFLITDREAISAVKSGKLRELSAGYEADFVQTGKGTGTQKNIRGNHVAIVQAGRAGAECAIFDHAPNFGEKSMSTKQKLMSIFKKTLDQEIPDGEDKEKAMDADPMEMIAALMSRVETLEAQMKLTEEEADVKDKTTDQDPEETKAEKAEDECTKDEGMGADMVGERLANIEAALMKIAGLQKVDEEQEESTTEVYLDAETLARAEILSPGIAKSKDIKKKALDAAYSTESGKKAISSLLSGKAFDSADNDMLFIAAAEVMKSANRSDNEARRAVADTQAKAKQSTMNAAQLNEHYAKIYSKK